MTIPMKSSRGQPPLWRGEISRGRRRAMARDGEGTKERTVGNFGVETHFFSNGTEMMETHVCEYLGRTMENHMQNCWSSFPCFFLGGQPTLRKMWRRVLRGNLSRPVFMVDFPYIMSSVLEVLWLGM